MPRSFRGWTKSTLLETDASVIVGSIPALYRPSAMIHNSYPDLYAKFGSTPGAWGMCRAPILTGSSGNPIDYTATGTNLAAGDAAMLSRAATFFADDMVTTPLSRGTLLIRFDTIQHRSSNPSGNWTKIGALDTSPGGAYYQTALAFFTYVFVTLGIKPAQYIGDTGVMVHCHNEVEDINFWSGTAAEYKAMLHRIYDAMHTVAPTAKLIAPTVQQYQRSLPGESVTATRSVCDYFAANGLTLGGIDIHSFQSVESPTVPKSNLAEAQTMIQQSLAANNMPLDTIVIQTEFQNNTPAHPPEANVRDDYRCAAYFASHLFESRRTGFSGACMAALPNLGNSPYPELFPVATESQPEASWGMLAYGFPAVGWAVYYHCNKPSLMLMKLFSLWSGGQEVFSNRSATNVGSSGDGFGLFSAVQGNNVFQLVHRWDRVGGIQDVVLNVKNPGKTLYQIRVYRFNYNTNSPKYVFDNSAGTPDQRAVLAVAAGDNPTYSTPAVSLPLVLTMEGREVALIQYIYS